MKKEWKERKVNRQELELRVLQSLEDENKVALLLTEEDLQFFIGLLESKDADSILLSEKGTYFLKGLKALKAAVKEPP